MERQTKIVCTIGPATDSPDMIPRLVEAGMNVARLNFSHGTHEWHARVVSLIREISAELSTPVAILQDLSGPKIRTGAIASSSATVLSSGSTFTLVGEEVPGDERRVSVTHFGALAEKLRPGNGIFLADGSIQLRVVDIDGVGIRCEVITGGELRSRQGINVPDVSLDVPAVTEKDLADLDFGMDEGVDFVALSFVRRASDLMPVKDAIQRKGLDTPVIAKIEKHEALDNIDEITDVADGIMIARGDLGIEIPLERVPVMQKMIINKAGIKGKPVITATQMLESMIEHARPTRAEVTDVANAIFDGTDAVMLSGETAIGRYPAETVATMTTIAARAEAAWLRNEVTELPELATASSIDSTIAYLSHLAALRLEAAAVVTYTQSGSTARRVCRHRPRVPILALTPQPTTRRKLALSWGVWPVLSDEIRSLAEVSDNAVEQVQRNGLARSGDTIVVTAGTPLGAPGNTNLLKVENVP